MNYHIETILVECNHPTLTQMHRVAIIDASGSMGASMHTLADDMTEWLTHVPDNDYVSIAWFSGEGQHDWFVRNAQVNPGTRAMLQGLVRTNLYPRNTTCFSECLTTLANVVAENPLPAQMTFFTDGYPVVSNYKAEEAAIFKAINQVAHQLTRTVLIGYRNHNVSLMARMAQQLGGQMIHSTWLHDFLAAQITAISDTDPVTEVEYPIAPLLAFQLTADAIEYVRWADGYLYAKPGTLFVLTTTDKVVPVAHIDEYYAAAALLAELGQADVAMEVLRNTGDKYYIDLLNNAMLPDEIIATVQTLTRATFETKERYTAGKVGYNYLPQPDAFCVLDLLQVLQAGDNYLVLDELEYKRTGQKRAYDSAITFEANTGQLVPISDFVWHSERMNLSVRYLKNGVATFEYAGQTYRVPTYVWRTNTVILDGKLNVTELPVLLDAATLAYLAGVGLTHGDTDDVHYLQLNDLPVMNRADTRPTAKALAELVLDELALTARQKALNSLLPKQPKTASTTFVSVYGQPMADWMALEGLTERGFSPNSAPVKSTDYYVAPTFSVSVKGMKSLPTADAVLKAAEKGGKTNLVRDVMLAELTANYPIETVQNRLQMVRAELRTVRNEINRIRFSVIMGKKWFADFDDYNQRELQTPDGLVLFEAGMTQVNV